MPDAISLPIRRWDLYDTVHRRNASLVYLRYEREQLYRSPREIRTMKTRITFRRRLVLGLVATTLRAGARGRAPPSAACPSTPGTTTFRRNGRRCAAALGTRPSTPRRAASVTAPLRAALRRLGP